MNNIVLKKAGLYLVALLLMVSSIVFTTGYGFYIFLLGVIFLFLAINIKKQSTVTDLDQNLQIKKSNETSLKLTLVLLFIGAVLIGVSYLLENSCQSAGPNYSFMPCNMWNWVLIPLGGFLIVVTGFYAIYHFLSKAINR